MASKHMHALSDGAQHDEPAVSEANKMPPREEHGEKLVN